jgi:(E)-4-hydroxy-3-methylbut-2-enyl-diphosphate synthase
MVKTSLDDFAGVIKEIKQLQRVKCEMVRIAIPTLDAAHQISKIKRQVSLPIIADIHFNPQLAIEALKQGADKIRLNPGNIKGKRKIKEIVTLAKERQVPIRVGVNSGSLNWKRFPKPTPEALAQSALEYIKWLEDLDFRLIVVSLKSSNIPLMIEAHKILCAEVNYPIHIGVTEAGGLISGIIRSTIGVSELLKLGIGDTLRVSLTAPSYQEVKVGYQILSALGIRQERPLIIACPQCGRTRVNLEKLVFQVERRLEKCQKPLKIAVMGCVVNGPGEAREADFGIAFGGKSSLGVIFKKGKIIKKVREREAVAELLKIIS